MIYNAVENKWELEGFGTSFYQPINDPATWNGRDILFLQPVDCAVPDDLLTLALPEGGDCFLIEREIDVLCLF